MPETDVIVPYPELGAHDICIGADPFVFKRENMWYLLLQEDAQSGALAHDGIRGYTLRRAARIEDLASARPAPLAVLSQEENLRQSWAAEIHYDKYLYVAISNGDNVTHRMRVYETEENVAGPWVDRGWLKYPPQDDVWAIDLTYADIRWGGTERRYGIWSGWEPSEMNVPEGQIVPQHIYIAEYISPFEIGPRHKIASPTAPWSSSIAPILEGPQTLMLNGEFRGIIVTGNASWTDKYATNVLTFQGGDPLSADSWHMLPAPLFQDGHGIGHGMIVEDGSAVYYVGHRKTRHAHGWEDRMVFYTQLDRAHLELYLQGAVPVPQERLTRV